MGKKTKKSDDVSGLAIVVANVVILPLMVATVAVGAIATWAICQIAIHATPLFLRLQGAKEEFVAPRGDD